MNNALAEARLVIELEERERRSAAPVRAVWARFGRALRLAPSLDVFEALLAGEAVPLDRLDPEWVRRYGLRGAA